MATWACASCGGENPEGMRFCGHCGTPVAAAASADTDVSDALRSFVSGPVADRLIETGGRLPEERRLITALFADVSGFTQLADRLDAEELLGVIDPVISGLSSVVGRYEGYVEKFAGDALLALFGAPVSHDDDAARALAVAGEMHRELRRICAELGPEADGLTLHVGVNSGHGIARILGSEARMDYAVLGDAVILAQRLESAAPPGETYVSRTTVRLTEGLFEFEPVGELTLKGKSEPVPACRLVGERAHPGRRARGSPLVGREEELARIGAVLDALSAGRGGLITVIGEPGVGKSRLTEQAQEHARARGLRWLQARCLSYGAGLAYWPYADLLRRFSAIRLDDEPPQAAERLGDALDGSGAGDAFPFFARLLALPAGNGEVAGLEPEAFRRGLEQAFVSWLRALAARGPLVLALEDMHWADSSSLALTDALARLDDDEAVMLLLVARPEAQAALAAVGAQVAREAIELHPLAEAEIRTLVETRLGAKPPPELPAFVAQRTAGNPFFVEELLRSLQDAEVLVRSNAGWAMRPGWDARQLPPTVEGVLSARIDLLPRSAASVLQTASVIGRRMRVSLLRAVAGAGDGLGAELAQLVESGFLDLGVEDGEDSVVFHHALVQDVAYSRLLRRRRRELHLRVAQVAEELYGAGDDTVDLLARHLYLGGGPKAVEYLVRAGERAKRLYANDEAILHLGRAAELVPGDPEILLALADLHELVGAYEEALRLYTQVRESTNDVRAWRGAASTLRKRGEFAEALAVVSDAFSTDELRQADLTPLWLEAGWCLSVAGRFEQAIDVLHAGLEIAGSRRDRTTAQLLLQLARAETLEGRYGEALEHGLEARAMCEERDDVRGLATAMRIVGDVYLRLERLDEARDTLRRGVQLAEQVGSVEEIGGCLINLGLVELERGELDEAIACDRRAIDEFERIGYRTGQATGYANLAEKLMVQEDYEQALEYAERALELARSIDHSLMIAGAIYTAAVIRLRQGAFSDAAERAEEAAGLFLDVGVPPYAADALEIAAEAWEQAGDRERAGALEAKARSLVRLS